MAEFGIMSCNLDECRELNQPDPIEAKDCRANVYAILNECPCRVTDLKISKTGKHGSTKAVMEGYDLFTGKKQVVMCPGSKGMYKFEPVSMDYELVNVQDNHVLVLNESGEEREFQLPENETGQNLKTKFETNVSIQGDKYWTVTVIYAPRGNDNKWMANWMIKDFKEGK